jgi:hypothetical protein
LKFALSFADGLFNTATRADESLPRRVSPASHGGSGQASFFGFRFSFVEEASASFKSTSAPFLFRAATLADPAKACVDEVGCLDHKRIDAGCRILAKLTSDIRHPTSVFLAADSAF